MKIFCKFPTVNISKLNFWLVICIAKNFIWTTLKAIFSIFDFFAPSDSRYLNSCISAKYCPILTNHTSIESLFINFQMRYKSQFKKLTLMTGFVVQGHIFHTLSSVKKSGFCRMQWLQIHAVAMNGAFKLKKDAKASKSCHFVTLVLCSKSSKAMLYTHSIYHKLCSRRDSQRIRVSRKNRSSDFIWIFTVNWLNLFTKPVWMIHLWIWMIQNPVSACS